MMPLSHKTLITSLLSSTILFSSSAFAGNGSISITGPQGSNYVATDNVTGSSFDTFTANSSTATFNQDLTVNKSKEVKDSILNFSGATVGGDVIGLERGYGGKTTNTNTINISGGTINGSVLGTSDKSGYNGSDSRASNNINLSNGNIGGNIEGGAGAANNVITITGGTVEKSNDGHSHDANYCDGNSGIGNDGNVTGSCKSGTIYAGVSDAATKNQSKDGTVILKNMTDSNSFLSTFTDGPDDLSGMIFGSNLTGTSNMQFQNVDGTYKGGFKNFDNMSVDADSNLILGGTAYYADNWTVNGSLNTNGKIAHTYKNSTLNLNVGNTGSLTQQFLSDANVNATNAGTIKGIKTDKNITLNNSGNMNGEYAGSSVNITNSGTINSVAGQNTIISSTNPGVLNNTGQIKETVSFSGQMSVNNNTGGNINAMLLNNQTALNINNAGTINNSSIVNFSNSNTTTINNNSGGVVSGSLALIRGTLNLNNQLGGSLTGNPFSTDAGTFNINNSGNMSGNSSLTATNGGKFNLVNNASGNITGGLTINSGLNTFTNNGIFNSLGITNHQTGVVLNNNKTISGTGSILSDSTFYLNNNSGGNITGTQTWKNVNLDNKSGATVNNLALTSDTGTVNIGNSGTFSGTNSLSASGGGSTNFVNNATGSVTGGLTINSGLGTFTNNGSFADLNITNHQSSVVLNNNKNISGTGSILSDTNFALNNNSGGNITGTQTWKNVTLDNKSGATVNNLALTSDTGTVNIGNSGTFSGTNSLSANGSGTTNFVNNATGSVTGGLTINSGLGAFTNNGTFNNLGIINHQNSVILNNNKDIIGTGAILSDAEFVLNNNSGGNITGNQTWKNVTLDNKTGATVNNLIMTSDNGAVKIKNSGTYSGNNLINSTNGGTTTFDNLSGGLLSGSLGVNNGQLSLTNALNGSISSVAFNANNAQVSITNNGTMNGTNSISGSNGGTVTLTNGTTGNLSGVLNTLSGLNNFSNAGTLHDLTLNNQINNLTLTNTNIINGTNVINGASGTTFNIANNASGNITGTMNNTGGILKIANNTGGTIDSLSMLVSSNGIGIQVDNTGTMKGNNTANATNAGGQIIINNNVGGELKDTLNTLNGATLNNSGLVNALTVNNSQNILNINNSGAGELRGTLTLNNSDDTKVINLNNQSTDTLNGALALKDGTLNLNNFSGSTINGYDMSVDSAILNLKNEGTIAGANSITNTNGGTATLANYTGGILGGTFGVIGGSLGLDNLSGGIIDSLDLKADNSTINLNNSGTMQGTNTLENANSGIINFVNKIGATLKDILNIKGGVETFDNQGTIAGLTVNNEQLALNIDNSGTISGTNNFNNTAGNTTTLTNESGGQITGTLNSKDGTFTLNNNSGALIHDLVYSNTNAVATISNSGIMNGHNSLQTTGGSLSFANLSGGLLSGQLDVLSAISPISNAGTINNLTLLNNNVSPLVLNNTGLVTGTDIFKNVNLNNQTGGFVNNASLTSDTGVLNIANSGTFNGNNTLNATNGGTTTFANISGGVVTGNLTVNGGLTNLNNSGGTIGGLTLTANLPQFTITNTGSIIGNNTLTADNEFKIINNGAGVVNSNLTINAPITTLEQHSSGDFLANLYGSSSTNTLNLINSTLFNSSLNGNMGIVNLTNTNSLKTDATLSLTNNGTIHNNINVNNAGYTKINNNGTILAALSDATSATVGDNACPITTLELNNSGNISGNMSVLNNIFKFDNTGNVSSDTIDARDLRLTNSGTISSANNYAFSIRGNVIADNAASGTIYGKDYAFKLLGLPVDGSDVKGVINNSGVIYSQGTTIGYDGIDIPCPNCYGSDLVINNYGKLVSVDVATLTNPDLNSHAISAENAVVNNFSGGLIGGSVHVKDYNQKAGATWITFMDKDLLKMSTILAEDTVNIENGSILTIYTNNDVKAFNNNDEFKLVEAKGMTEAEVKEQINNFTIRTDSPFANYQMIGKNTDEGYIVFNHVAPTTYATATDLATASHNATILGSQRMYELFVNRDVNQIQGLASGDSFNTTNKLNFMPLGGTAHQGDKDGHAGYDTNYYGGLGYFEHDFNNNFKGGLGFAYMNNSTDFNDADKSSGNIDSYRPFAYINYEQGAWRVDLAGGIAKHKVDNTRKYTFNDRIYSSKAKYDADEISGHLNIGYKMLLENNLVVQPMIGAYAAQLKTDSFRETGSGPMNMSVKSEDYNSFKSMIGMKLSKEYQLDNGASIKPELHMRWYHELGDTKGGVSAFFLAQEQLFNTSGIETPKDIGDVALRLTTKSGKALDLFTEAYYQFGDKFYNVGGTVGLQYNF